MFLSRRATLQLSINAIVILVIALVVLALGLSFTRSLFGKGQGNLERAIENSRIDPPADQERSLVIDRTVKVRVFEQQTFRVSFYNDHLSTVSVSPADMLDGTELIECLNGDGATGSFRLSSPAQVAEPSEVVDFDVIIKPWHAGGLSGEEIQENAASNDPLPFDAELASVPVGTYTCQLRMDMSDGQDLTGQFIVEVSG